MEGAAQSLNIGLNEGRAKDTPKLVWITFEAPGCERSREWEQSLADDPVLPALESEFQRIRIRAHEDPALDLAAQVLMQSMGMPSGWPLHLFLVPGELKAILGVPSLKPAHFKGLLTKLCTDYRLHPEELVRKARDLFREASAKDEMSTGTLPEAGSGTLEEQYHKALAAFLTPCEQSWNFRLGTVGGGNFHTQRPQVYLSLLELGGHREWVGAALARLARTALTDVVGGGFFRAWDEENHVVSTEKLLVEQAELLQAYLLAIEERRDPWLVQVAAQTIRFVEENFFEDGRYASGMTGNKAYYHLQAADLLETLSGDQRRAAQLFFGLGGQVPVPVLNTDVSSLAQELGQGGSDVQNLLFEAQGKLARHRVQRTTERPEALRGEPTAEAAWVMALIKAQRLLENNLSLTENKSLRSRVLKVLARWEEDGLDELSPRAQLARARAWAAAERLMPEPQESWLASARKVFRRFTFEKVACEDTFFLGKRWQLCDHMGMSAGAHWLHLGLDLGAVKEVDHVLPHALERVRRVGLAAAGVYGAAARRLRQSKT